MRFFSAVLALCGAAIGCSSSAHPPPPLFGADTSFDVGPTDSGTSAFDVARDSATFNCADGIDAGVCACTELGQTPPALYILLDKSGSMEQIVAPSTVSKWDQVRRALFDSTNGVLRKLGSRLSVGMALFPSGSGAACAPGVQVFPIGVGLSSTYDTLASILSSTKPAGSTPTASSVSALIPLLKSRKAGTTFVLLATDGAPNCGTTACSAEQCQYDIDGAKLSDGTLCAPPLNCCDQTVVMGGDGWKACNDEGATRKAVAALAAAGINTFVLGIPGTERYATTLDDLALAGGEAQATAGPRYYAATDGPSLEAALSAIAAKVIDTCVIALETDVTDPGITNVLVDGTLVPKDDVSGWSWLDSSHIQLNGTTCDNVHAGRVSRIQVAVGCKTIER